MDRTHLGMYYTKVNDFLTITKANFSFETDEGFSREEIGTVVNPGEENTFIAVIGSYKYFDSEGQIVEVHYTSDDRGFVPYGSHISERITNNAKALSQTKAV